MPKDISKKQWSQAVTHVLCIGGGKPCICSHSLRSMRQYTQSGRIARIAERWPASGLLHQLNDSRTPPV